METNTYNYIIKKYNIEVGKQYIIDIPNMSRNDMAELFGELGFNKGAEVGVENGYYSEILCKANPNLHLSCIDPWSAGAYEEGIDAIDVEQKKYDERYEECVKILKPYNCTIIRKGSMEALEDFEDESLDFVYIDANHDFPNFTNDLHYWLKKIRPGGIVSGHDYAIFSYKKHNHVKRALEGYARSYRMQPLFIVGSLEYDKGTTKPSATRDKYRSWFWVKK
ncbi:hypothetical protein CMO96_05135 [Candidatus Woesebacteria bacterium]|nr:hypothetical protein [Candidatus Woesebacteria bacterium]